ncbi:hypothetical protein BDK51DRAFT_22322, partial [Blyttiomyces helicus]
PVHRMIQSDFIKVASISYEARPRQEDALEIGWGAPGSPLQNINFKEATIQTIEILEQRACAVTPDMADFLERDPVMTARRYVEFLITENIVDRDVARYYIQRYEEVRFGPHELTQADYLEFMKLFALLLKRYLAVTMGVYRYAPEKIVGCIS